MILRSTLSAFLEDLTPFLDEVIGGDFDPYPMLASQFLNQKTMDTGWTDIGTRSTLGAFAIKDETAEQAEDNYIIGPQMRVSAVEYAKRVPTTRIAIEDARNYEVASGMLAGTGKDIRQSADNTKEILGHDLLNATSHLTPDGIALFSASHVNLQGDTFSNLNTSSALTEATLEAAITDLKQMTDDRGFPISQTAAKLIVPIGALEWVAAKILNSTLSTTVNQVSTTAITNVNDINVLARQSIQVVASPYLTSATTWFLQATDHGLNWYDRESSRVWNDADDNRAIIEQGMTFRSAHAAADPRGIMKNTA